MYKIFLDDMRQPRTVLIYAHTNMLKYYHNDDEWIIVRNYHDFVTLIEEKLQQGQFPTLISFDHDLADIHYDGIYEGESIEKTGYDCAKWLVNLCIDYQITLPQYLVHSQNTVGNENIKSYLDNFKKYQEKS